MPIRDAFYSGHPAWWLWTGLLTGLALVAAALLRGAGGQSGGALPLLAAAVAVTACFAVAIWNRRRRPVFEIRDGAIEYGSIFRPAATRRRIGLDEIAALEPGGGNHLIVTTRAGRTLRIPLHEVPVGSRPDLWRALERGLRSRVNAA